MPPLVLDGTNGVSGVDGTASNPSYEGTDSNTGIFYPAADTVAIGTGGTERVRVSSAGVFGVNTTSPAAIGANYGTIDIRGSSGGGFNLGTTGTLTGQIYGNAGGITYDAQGALTHFWYTNSLERMRLDASGRLGIGTSSPNRNVVVDGGSSDAYLKLTTSATANNFASGILFNNTLNSDGNVFIRLNGGQNSLLFGVGGTERVFMTSTGFVGIGIASPGAMLAVNASDNSYNAINCAHSGATAGNLQVASSNASFAGNVIESGAVRSANSAYSLFSGYSANFADREFNLRGDGTGYSDGGWTTPAADYAEYFESVDGTEIPRGTTVVLEDNKIRAATESDPASSIIGIIRPKDAQMILGNNAMERWNQKYLKDDFGSYLYDEHDVIEWTDEEGKLQTYESHRIPSDVAVPDDAMVKTHDDKGRKFQHRRLNPAYDASLEYTPREDRVEWNVVGLLGQVPMLKGQPVNDRWIKMRDVSETVEEWMIR